MADDLMQMQRQAARRVQQMQEHSRRVFEEHQGRTPESLEAARTPGWWQQEPLRSPGLFTRQQEERPAPPPPPPSPSPSAVTLSLPELDREQWMLLGLALLLFRSGCRTELLLALLYLAF